MQTDLINKINSTPWQIFLAITGGGQTLIGNYLSVSGGSKVIKGALVPYSQQAFDKFVKGKVENYSGEQGARKLAVASYHEAIACGASEDKAFGFGMTCSLAKDGERVGREHRINIATHQSSSTDVLVVKLNQGRTRAAEELLAADLGLLMLAYGTGCIAKLPDIQTYALLPGEHCTVRTAGSMYQGELLSPSGKVGALYNKRFSYPLTSDKLVIYPGSWNPLHEGHRKIWQLAQTILKSPPIMELSVLNADKGQLDFIDLQDRVIPMYEYPYVLTRSATFIEKARYFREGYDGELIFVVGADTWVRLWDAKYAGPPPVVYKNLKELGVKFLVFGRDNLTLGQAYADLRIENERAANFVSGLRSSDLRKAKV